MQQTTTSSNEQNITNNQTGVLPSVVEAGARGWPCILLVSIMVADVVEMDAVPPTVGSADMYIMQVRK